MSKVKTSLIALTAIMATIMILGVSPAFAQTVEEIEMAYGYSETTLSPNGVTSVFLTTNEEAGIWVKINNPSGQVTFKFYYELNGVEKEYTGGYSRVDVIPKEDTSWGIAFATMDIDGKTPSFNPGVWTAKVFIDGDLVALNEFRIFDYSSITSLSDSIAAIREEVAGIKAEKNEVVESYNALVDDYDTLIEDYEDLEDSTFSEVQFMNLNNDYESLLEEYEDLEDAQGSTRSMMYGSIVVALIAVVVAVYFGLMKK